MGRDTIISRNLPATAAQVNIVTVSRLPLSLKCAVLRPRLVVHMIRAGWVEGRRWVMRSSDPAEARSCPPLVGPKLSGRGDISVYTRWPCATTHCR